MIFLKRKRHFIVGVIFCYSSSFIIAQSIDSSKLIVHTKQGKVEGILEKDVFIWKGIRYAQAPIGNLRFSAPQPPENWEGIKFTKEFGAIAPQQKSKRWKKHTDEDCLFLNIWTPNTNTTKRPVMFWIHGGGFYTGASSHPLYNGAGLAQKGDVVIVTINYRLGPLGFLFFDDIKGENKGFDNNLGIRDQIAALKWVKENIENFGGDPENITIFGQSAGATSVLTMASMPSTKGLYQKIIVQSPALDANWTREEATMVTKNYLKMFGIAESNLSDLYKISADSLVVVADRMIEHPTFEVPGIATFAPTIDGKFIETTPDDSVSLEQIRKTPLLIGTNRHEMNIFMKIPLMPFSASEKEVHKVFASTDCSEDEFRVTSFYKKYPRKQSVLNICTDRVFRMPSIAYADEHSKTYNTYMYRFDWNSTALNLSGYKAFHALDLFFVFNTFDTKHGKKVMFLANKRKVAKISNTMQEAWVNFSKTGNPNNSGSDKWKPYDSKNRGTMVFDKKTRLVYDPDRKHRLAWGGLELQ